MRFKSGLWICALFLVLLSFQAVSAALTDNILAYYTFDQTSGNVFDSLGLRNFTQQGTVGSAAGKIGTSRGPFSASNYFNRTNDAGFSGATNQSWAGWFNFTSGNAAYRQRVVGVGDEVGGVWEFAMYVDSSGTNKLVFRAWSLLSGCTDAGNIYNMPWSYALQPYHIAFTRSISGTTGNNSIYINGVLNASWTDTGCVAAPGSAGIWQFGHSNAYSQGFSSGTIDETGFWNRTLSAAEVTQLYNTGSGLTYPFSTSVDPIRFISQNPASLTTTNIFNQNINITYNYTNTNLTSPQLNYSVTGLACVQSINGTCFFANNTYVTVNQASNSTTGTSSLISFTLTENDAYPYVANLNASVFNQTHSSFTDTLSNHATSISFINVSTVNSYGILEAMANSTGDLRVYACNSSYDFSSSLLTNGNCQEIGNIVSTSFNHSHGSFSSHNLIPFTIINGKLNNGITATSNMTFLFREIAGTSQVFYVSNFSRTGVLRTTNNNGITWTDQSASGTADSHLHQYPLSGVFINYRGQGTYNSVLNYTTLASSQIQITQLEPAPPIITLPSPGGYNQTNMTMNITWLNATAFINGSTIARYNITLLNSDLSYNRTINGNVGLNNSYAWNVFNENLSVGNYYVRVYAFDNFSLSSYDQELFTLQANAYLDVAVNDALTDVTLNTTTSLNVTEQETGFKRQLTSSNGFFYNVSIVKGYTYTFDADNLNYAYVQANYTANQSLSQFLKIQAYKTNSIQVNIYDVSTNLPILQTSNILLSLGNVSLTYTTTTGSKFIDSIPEGIYDVTISSSNYSSAFYTITMQNRTTQTLNAYLSNSFSNIGIYTKSMGGDPLYFTDITIQQLINGSYSTVANKKTDILGYALFQLTEGQQYRFVMTPAGTGFETKVFLMEVYAANQPYNIVFTLGGFDYYKGFEEYAKYNIYPNETILANDTQVFGITSYSINGTILYTYVNCTKSDGSWIADNVTGFPNGATAEVFEDLSNYHGRYVCTFILSVDGLTPRITTIPYYISGNTAFNNNLIQASDKFRQDLSTIDTGSGSAWQSIIAIFIILVAAITAHQLSSGMSRISTITALAGVIVFAYLGWIPVSISFFIVIIGGFLVFYREAY